MSGTATKPVHALLKNISWMVGRWQTDAPALCHYPTMKDDVKYVEHLEIADLGIPVLSYRSYTFAAENKKPMHQELGFIRANPEQPERVALILSHINGLAEVEEGEANGDKKEMTLDSQTVGRMSFGKLPACTKITRHFKLIDENTLEQVIGMATTETPPTEHLKAVYKKQQ